MPSVEPAFIFDLDGTLIDSVYQYVLAWRQALEEADLCLAVWRIHRRIGMSGGPLAHALARETGRQISPELPSRLASRLCLAFRYGCRHRLRLAPFIQ